MEARQYIDSNQVDLCVTVLASFGSTHVDDLKLANDFFPIYLAGTRLDKNISILTKRRALHRETNHQVSSVILERVMADGK